MSYLGDKLFLLEVQKGNVAGHSIVHKFGRNDAVPNGTWEMISLLSGTASFLAAASTVRVKAGGDVADTAAGAGAREITVVGIDSTLAEATEAIATAGANASSATTASFWRVYRAYVSAVGTYGVANTGAVTIEATTGPTDLLQIAAEEGQSQHGAYSIPTGKTGYVLGAFLTADASKAADFKVVLRENFTDVVAPMSSYRVHQFWDGILGPASFYGRSPSNPLAALSDIWFEARGGGAATEVSVDFDILLVDD
jgi:hypothetical protein